MQNVELYINGQRADLFDNDRVTLQSSIQDIRDIQKVFTDYTKGLSLPASKTNNKIFKHFYNFDIVGGFNARKKESAELHINYAPFKIGKIALNSVNMRNNKPFSYNVTFFSNILELSDRLGSKLLSELPYLRGTYDHDLNEATIKEGFEDGLDLNGQTNSIIYPLISPKKRLYFDSRGSSAPVGEIFSGNLYHESFVAGGGGATCNPSDPSSCASTTQGLTWNDLKPAIRAIHVIEAIEDQINIDFTRDFFGTTAFDNLYLWLNTNPEDNSEIAEEQNAVLTNWNLYNGTSAINQIFFTGENLNMFVNVTPETYKYELTWNVSITGTPVPYVGKIIDNATNQVLFQFEETTANLQVTRTFINYGSINPVNIRFEITSTGSLSFNSNIKIDILSQTNVLYDSVEYETGISGGAVSTQGTLELYKQFPKIKALDFLTGIWKMFNLTAYYVDDIRDSNYGKIYVDTLDNYYNSNTSNPLGGVIDLQNYIDVTESVIDSALPYTQINFKYQEPDTLLAEQHLEKFGYVFGNEEYSELEENVDNERQYDINVPFAHFKYERLLDTNTSLNTTRDTLIQWGYSASGDINETTGDYTSVISAPLLFYAIRETNLPAASASNDYRDGRINWINGLGTGSALVYAIENYWRPSNSNEDGTTSIPPQYTLNFDNEIDEWQSVDYGTEAGSLFKNFYSNYISEVFDAQRRLSKFTCHLPIKIVQNFKLNDYIKIQFHLFKINSIKIDLNSGKAEIELLNIIQD